MQTDKRKFKRFDLPLIVKFRPTYGSTDYALGLTKNFSYDGLGLESSDFNFIPNENLEMNLKFPQSGSFVTLSGDVVWKRQEDDKCLAGVKIRMENPDIQSKIMQKISSYGNIPYESILPSSSDGPIESPAEERSAKADTGKPAKPKQYGFIKQYVKNGSKCKVTFRLPKEAAPDAKSVMLVGEFNDWDQTKTPMTKLKSGEFLVTLDLKSNHEYKFRYLIDGERWENDWSADRYDPNEFGSDDSVVVV